MEFVKVKATRGEGYWLADSTDPRLATGEFKLWVEPEAPAVPTPPPSVQHDVRAAPTPQNNIEPYNTPITPRGRRGK